MQRPSDRDVLTRRDLMRLIGVGAAAGALLSLGGCGCTPELPPQEVPPVEPWTSPYDWDALMTNPEGRKYYYPDNVLSSRFGIDVSDYNHTIDWAAVASDGVQFAILRAGYRGYTEGGLFEDEQFAANLQGARENRIPVGAYFFSSAVSAIEAQEEARFVLDLLGDTPLDYPIVYDQEQVPDSAGRANTLASSQYTANAKAFCEAVTAAGYQTMIYGNKHHLSLLHLDELADYPLWYAEYGASEPSGHFDFTMWQYSESGTVKGIENGVDLNIFFTHSNS